MDKEASKGMWKRTFNIFTKIKIPFVLYVLQVIMGIISTKVGLLYIPYYSKMQTGQIDDNSVIWGYFGFILLTLVVGMIAVVPEFYASSQITRNVQIKLMHKVIHLPVKRFEQETAGELITRITLDSELVNSVIVSIIGFITGIASGVMAMKEMSGINNALSYIVIPVFIYIIFCAWVDGRIQYLTNRRIRNSLSRTTAFFSEHMPFILDIKQLNAQNEELERGKKAIDIIYKADIYNAFMGLITSFITGSTNNIIAIIIFVVGSKSVREGVIDIVALSEFYQYILIAYGSLSVIPDLYTSFMRSNGELFYVGRLLDSEEEQYQREERMSLEDKDIVFKNVSFAYDSKNVFENLNCTIPCGKKTALVGLNGSGKTTMLKLIERFYTADDGEIFFGDTPVEKIHLDEWRQSFGYVLQKPRLFNASIRENIAYGIERDVTDDEIISAAKMVSAYDFIERIPEGLDFSVGDNGCRLSQGERQRIAIARAIMIDPSYLLLDEATSNVDVHSKKIIDNTLESLMKGRTTVFISHSIEEIKKADHIIVLNNGRAEAQGSIDEVFKSSSVFRKIINGGIDDEI